jgi:tetratricopeptide (TPR) repeat protein
MDWKAGLARCVLKQQKFGETVVLLQELIEVYPDKVDFWILQASAYLGLKEPMKAVENYETLARMGKATADSLYLLGEIYVSEGMMDLAARAYEQSLLTDPQQSLMRPLRAAEVLTGKGEIESARSFVSKLKQTCGERMTTEEKKRLLKIEARVSMAEGIDSEASQVLEEIVRLDPLDGEALMLLGQHYQRAGHSEKSIFYYERAASLETFEADAKVKHAQILVAQAKFQEALPLLKRSQELKPRDAVVRYLEQVERIAKSKR